MFQFSKSLAIIALAFCVTGCGATTNFKKSGQTELTTLKAKGSITLNNGEFKGRLILAVQKPDNLRIEVPGPLGQTMGVFISNKDNIFVDAPTASEETGQKFMWERNLLPFTYEAKDLIIFLLNSDINELKGNYNFTYNDARLVVKADKLDQDEKIIFTAHLKNYKKIHAKNIPFEITLENPDSPSITIKLNKVKVNVDLPAKLFEIPKK